MNRHGLNPCPFCGNDEVLLYDSDIPAEVGVLGYCVQCHVCGTKGPHGDKTGAKGQWNCWLEESRKEFVKEKDKKIAALEELLRFHGIEVIEERKP